LKNLSNKILKQINKFNKCKIIDIISYTSIKEVITTWIFIYVFPFRFGQQAIRNERKYTKKTDNLPQIIVSTITMHNDQPMNIQRVPIREIIEWIYESIFHYPFDELASGNQRI
jgi:hypothetical protein